MPISICWCALCSSTVYFESVAHHLSHPSHEKMSEREQWFFIISTCFSDSHTSMVFSFAFTLQIQPCPSACLGDWTIYHRAQPGGDSTAVADEKDLKWLEKKLHLMHDIASGSVGGSHTRRHKAGQGFSTNVITLDDEGTMYESDPGDAE